MIDVLQSKTNSLEQYKQLSSQKELELMQKDRKIQELKMKYKEAAELLKVHVLRADKAEEKLKKEQNDKKNFADEKAKLKSDMKRGGYESLLTWASKYLDNKRLKHNGY